MPMNMVISKFKYLIEPGSGLFPHPFELVLMRAHAGAESSYSVVADGGPDPRPGKNGKILHV